MEDYDEDVCDIEHIGTFGLRVNKNSFDCR